MIYRCVTLCSVFCEYEKTVRHQKEKKKGGMTVARPVESSLSGDDAVVALEVCEESRTQLCCRCAGCVAAVVCAAVVGVRFLTDSPSLRAYLVTYRSAIGSGALSGALHAVTGVDHFLALIPVALHRRCHVSGPIGCLWGFGHGLSTVILGTVAFGLRDFLADDQSTTVLWLSQWSDALVALTMIVIGVMGLAEVQQFESDGEHENSHMSSSVTSSRPGWLSVLAVMANGLCLGLSIDVLPSLAPVLPMNQSSAGAFLIAYLIATALAMGFCAALLGESSHWMTRSWRESDSRLANRLAKKTSIAAAAIGLVMLATLCIASSIPWAAISWIFSALSGAAAIPWSLLSSSANDNDNVFSNPLIDWMGPLGKALVVIVVAALILIQCISAVTSSSSVSCSLPLCCAPGGHCLTGKTHKSEDELL